MGPHLFPYTTQNSCSLCSLITDKIKCLHPASGNPLLHCKAFHTSHVPLERMISLTVTKQFWYLCIGSMHVSTHTTRFQSICPISSYPLLSQTFKKLGIYMLWHTARIRSSLNICNAKRIIAAVTLTGINIPQYSNVNLRMGFTLCSSSFRLIILAVSSFIIVGISSEAMRASACPSQSPTWPRSPCNPESSSHSQWWSYKNYFRICCWLHNISHWQSLLRIQINTTFPLSHPVCKKMYWVHW